jgi:hypothetical protein
VWAPAPAAEPVRREAQAALLQVEHHLVAGGPGGQHEILLEPVGVAGPPHSEVAHPGGGHRAGTAGAGSAEQRKAKQRPARRVLQADIGHGAPLGEEAQCVAAARGSAVQGRLARVPRVVR